MIRTFDRTTREILFHTDKIQILVQILYKPWIV